MAANLSFQLLFFLILVTAATITATQDEEMIAEFNKCTQEEQKQPLTICRMFLKDESGSDSRPFLRYERGNVETLIQCCKQLQQVSNTCRCELLNMMTRELMMKEMEGDQCHGQCEQMRMKGVFLPLMCNIGPPCRFSYGGGSATIVKY